jgi:tetratricopeptide (TPR) repeat protein
MEGIVQHYTGDTALCRAYVDSAKTLIRVKQLSDSFFITPLYWESRLLWLKDKREQAFRQLDSAIMVAKAGNYQTKLIRLYELKGKFFYKAESYRESEKWYKEAAGLAEAQGLKLDAAQIRIELGIVQMELENFKKAQQTFLESLKTFEASPDYLNLAKTHSNIGVIYNRLGDTDKALEYYRKALATYSKKMDSLSVSQIYMNIGTLYRKTAPDSSLYYFDRSEQYVQNGSHPAHRIKLMFNRAIFYFDTKQQQKALEMFDSVLELSRRNKMTSGIARSYLSLSISWSRLGDLPKAARLSDSAIFYSLLGGEKMILNTCYENKMEILSKQQKFREAFETSELARRHSDSLDAISTNLSIRKMENDFEYQKKELENLRLNQLLDQQQQFSRRQTAALIFFILLSVVMLILYRHNRILQRERSFAYDALMEKYVLEKENRVKTGLSDDTSMLGNGSGGTPTLLNRLITYFDKEKPYHDPALKRATVEEYLQVTDKELTQALREHRTRTFNAFVNLYRVEEVKRRMEDVAYSHFTIEALALEAGFGSRQNFYKVFETTTGVKPSHYRSRFLIEANKADQA